MQRSRTSYLYTWGMILRSLALLGFFMGCFWPAAIAHAEGPISITPGHCAEKLENQRPPLFRKMGGNALCVDENSSPINLTTGDLAQNVNAISGKIQQ